MSDEHEMGIPPYEPERDRELDAQRTEEDEEDEAEQATLDDFESNEAYANSTEEMY